MDKVAVKICQREYKLKTDEPAEKIEKLAAQLEKTINWVSNKLMGKSEIEVVTYAALLMVSDVQNVLYSKSENEFQSLEKELEEVKAELEATKEKLRASSDNEAINNELMIAKAKIVELTDEVTSATSELNQLADVKTSENSALRSQLKEYEKEFENLSQEREAEIAKLRESYFSANKEMEQLADEKETENERLRSTISSYEATFDVYVKSKEDEIQNLQIEVERLKGNNTALVDKLAKLGDVQLTIC